MSFIAAIIASVVLVNILLRGVGLACSGLGVTAWVLGGIPAALSGWGLWAIWTAV